MKGVASDSPGASHQDVIGDFLRKPSSLAVNIEDRNIQSQCGMEKTTDVVHNLEKL